MSCHYGGIQHFVGTKKNRPGNAEAVFDVEAWIAYIENDEPQPQVDWAFGFLMTNWAPSRSSL